MTTEVMPMGETPPTDATDRPFADFRRLRAQRVTGRGPRLAATLRKFLP